MDKLLSTDMVQTQKKADDWQAVAKMSGSLLLEKDLIEEKYIEAMIKAVEEHGMYIVIAPGIALFHARPEQGVKETGLSLITLKGGVNFGVADKDPVYLAFALAAKDKTSHLDLLSNLSKVLQDQAVVEKLKQALDEKTLVDVLNQKLKEETK